MKRIRANALALAVTVLATALASPALAQDAGNDEQIVEGRGMAEMVLIHGLGSSASVWDEIMPYLRDTFRVWLYEIPGHGSRPPIPAPTIERVAEDMRSWLEEQGVVHPTLVGHAMGGLVAMTYAFEHPEDVKQLILIDAAPRQLASHEQKIEVAEQLQANYDEFVASRYLRMSPDPDIAHRVMDEALRTDSATFISMLMSSFDFDLTEQLPRQAVPILVIGSNLFFPDLERAHEDLNEMGWATARTISFKTMEKTGHYVMLEQPSYLASVMVAFVISHGLH